MDRRPSDGRGSALERMHEDHRALLATVDAFEAACARPPRGAAFAARTVRPIADRLALEYAAHVAEEDGLLALLLDGPVSTLQLAQEHKDIAAMLETFRATLERPADRERDEQLRVQAGDLVALLRYQIRKEETLVFAIVARQAARPRPTPPAKRRPPKGEPS